MEKMDGKTIDIVAENVGKLKELFPGAFTEGKVDFEALKEVLGTFVDDRDERYSFTWNGKSKARMIAQTPSTGTLRPCKEESVDWDSTQNIFIEGDNLEVLKLLQKSYHKKVKVIYIDPPYNTGKDFVYKDNFKDNIKNYKEITGQLDGEGRNISNNPETSGRYHTDWLNMIYPRLKLARNLLSDDGVVFISLDDNEIANLRKICDEIFGEENFLSKIIIQSNKRGQTYKDIAKCHEYLLVYYKSDNSSLGELDKADNSLPFSDQYGPYDLWELRNRNPKFGRHNRPNLYYPIYIDPNSENDDGLYGISLKQSESFSIEVFPKNSAGEDSCWRWGKEKVQKEGINANPQVLHGKARRDGGWNIYEKSRKSTTKAKSIWADTKVISEQGTVESGRLEMGGLLEFPKPLELVKRCIQLASSEDELILDFFAGSSTTAHAVMQLNTEDKGERKFIMVQLPEFCDEKTDAYKAGYKTIAEISKERIRRSATKIKEENPDYDGDLGFKVFKLDSTNVKPWEVDFDMTERTLEDFISNIKTDRHEEDVLYEVLLKYGLDLILPITKHSIAGQKVFDIGMGALIICLADAISLEVVDGIVQLVNQLKPEYIDRNKKELVTRVVFKDSGFENDVVKTNAVQILKQADIKHVRSL
jgi:adenine-specific DNA-methyltransferase